RDPESRQFRPVFIQFEELWFASGLQACRVQPCADSPFGRIAAKISSSLVVRRSLPAHTLKCAIGYLRTRFDACSAIFASPARLVPRGWR
ncbi:MAG: hypothetical protein NTY84_09690, partial [Verrucomicrobia bacterium]|nr:hypothetical protein [Verrucomicrobiota bacterium]